MDFARLGATGLEISRIGLGCEALGGTDWGSYDLNLAMHTVKCCADLGVNVFDTADVYGLGRSEERLSQALGEARSRTVIISKCGIRWQSSPGTSRARTFRDGSAAWIKQAVEASLRRLRVETIPLYLVHWPDPNTPVTETIAALDTCRRDGKIAHIGVSNFNAAQLREAHEVASITIAELPYHLLNRGAESELFPLCQILGIAIVAYGPLAQGLLTGKYDVAVRFGSDDRRHRLPHFKPDKMTRHLETVGRLAEVANHRGRSIAQVALRWVLDHPAISCVIVGAKSSGQISDNLGALGWTLKQEERVYLEGANHR